MKKQNYEEVKETIKNHIESDIKKRDSINAIISNTDYITWLEKFTKEYPGFTDVDWLYGRKKLDKNNYQNVDKLLYLYDAITEYASRNYIYPHDDNGIYYVIKYNNIAYEIGVMVGQGIITFCTRSTKIEKAIDFNNIINNQKTERTDLIKDKLIELQNYLNNLINDDIPVEALKETTQKVLQKRK